MTAKRVLGTVFTLLLTGVWLALLLGGWGSPALRGRAFGVESDGQVDVGCLVMSAICG